MNPEDHGLITGHRERDILGKSEAEALGGEVEEGYRSLHVADMDYLLEFTVGKLGVSGGTFLPTLWGSSSTAASSVFLTAPFSGGRRRLPESASKEWRTLPISRKTTSPS
jgi:hypothetical protein